MREWAYIIPYCHQCINKHLLLAYACLEIAERLLLHKKLDRVIRGWIVEAMKHMAIAEENLARASEKVTDKIKSLVQRLYELQQILLNEHLAFLTDLKLPKGIDPLDTVKDIRLAVFECLENYHQLLKEGIDNNDDRKK